VNLHRSTHLPEKPVKKKRRSKLLKEGYLTGDDIKSIRKKLGLTQKEMAEKLGVGLKTFARYENFSVRQSKAMDNLLRILERYPEALDILENRRL